MNTKTVLLALLLTGCVGGGVSGRAVIAAQDTCKSFGGLKSIRAATYYTTGGTDHYIAICGDGKEVDEFIAASKSP